jgi:D-tyrosyl-tRNA(Tyr) deacylase
MIVLLQRVSRARVEVAGETVARIGHGLLALVAIEPRDGEPQLLRMRERLLGYRVFGDEQGRMNRSLLDVDGGLLLVSQFTLAADTDSGMRPSFTAACPPERARELFERFCALCREQRPGLQTGVFGAAMQVELVNDGPVTFRLRVAAQSEK